MRVSVVNVREVWVLMQHRLVSMPVIVRFPCLHSRLMLVLVVLIVQMGMGMFNRVMSVLMFMAFRQMKPYA